MTKNKIILLVSIVALLVAACFYWTAEFAKERSDEILKDFKTVEESLQKSKDSLPQQNAVSITAKDSGLTAYYPDVDLSFMTNRISRSIDSLQEELRSIKDRKEVESFSYKDKKRILRLKRDLSEYNVFVKKYYAEKKHFTSNDFINLDPVSSGADVVSWEKACFENTTAYAALTILSSVSNKLLSLQRKAVQPN